MTDKELDEKLIAAFDNVRADSAVKARIRKGLTGDIMDNNKTITVSKTADQNERTGKIKVNRRGRIAAAVIAGVLAVGGGSYLLKNGFARVEPNTSLSSKTDSDSSSAHSDKMTYNGKEVDEMPITNEQLGFDPSGNSIYDKFSGYCDIRNLPNGNFLVRLQTAIPIEDDVISTCYCVYDPSVNSITGILPTNDWNCYSIGKNSIVFCSTDRDAENKIGDDKGKVFTTNLSCKLYDLDLCEMENDTLNFQLGDKHVEEVMVSADNKIYVAAREDYSDNKEKLYIYDSEGSVINTSEECDWIYSCSMSLDGGFIYYATQNRDSWSTTLKCIAVDDKHIDCEHTDGVYDDNPWPHYAMYFDSGKYLYTVYYTDEGKQMIRRIDMTGEEEIYFGEPEDVINYAGDVADYRYVTPDGKYLFTYNVKDKYTEDGGIEREYEIISTYDIENGLKLVHEEKVNDFMWLSSYGLNLLYNGATGDVCFGGYKDEDEKMFAEICFNLFGNEFSNFNINESANDNTKAEEKESIKTESDTNTEKMVTVPDITGFYSEDGEIRLRSAGFTVLLKSMYSDDIPEGLVVSTEPAGGEKAPHESMITMYTSKGPESDDHEHTENNTSTDTSATIPDVIGNEAEDAERKLTEAGFKPVLRSAYDDAHEGQVVRIEPAAG
ncbi:MAG: PASTA domain-containing protein, partial [Ruminococcus sp.]|nr:PASTA domain-containing protein [Ruminococcus sp.]